MKNKEIAKRLQFLKKYCEEQKKKVKNTSVDNGWDKDIEALDGAIEIVEDVAELEGE